MKVTVHDPIPVHIAPVNEATARWGVCAIPWMWRYPDGRLMIRVNGHQDTSSPDYRQEVPDAFYVSEDEGNTWKVLEYGPRWTPMFTGSEPPFIRRRDGSWINLRMAPDLSPLSDVAPIKTVPYPSLEALYNVYRYGDISDSCKAMELAIYSKDGILTHTEPCRLDFPELEVCIVGASKLADGQAILIDEYVPVEEICFPPHRAIQGILELPDGTLTGMVYGQCPTVSDREYSLVYMVVSNDGGRNWKMRSVIGVPDPDLDFGYTYENSMLLLPDGSLLVVMRTEHCVPKEVERVTSTMFARSTDLGYSWSKPVPIADSSVTPHLVQLENGVIVLVYGRPGVHLRYSTDQGQSWSNPISIIGRTLEEHLANGDEYMSCKYWDQDTYANTSLYAVSADTVLLLYNDMKYQTGDGLNHRATLVRKITFHPAS